MGTRSSQAQRRRNRQRKAERREFRRHAVLSVVVDYFPAPTGGWVARIAPDGLDPARGQGVDAHETFHDVMDVLEQFTERTGTALATIHRLNGSTTEWAELAAREGFLDCASSSMSHGVLLTD